MKPIDFANDHFVPWKVIEITEPDIFFLNVIDI